MSENNERTFETDNAGLRDCMCGVGHKPNRDHYPRPVRAWGPAATGSGGGLFTIRGAGSARNEDANETTQEIERAGEEFSGLLRNKQLSISSSDPTVERVLAHSNLQAVINHVVGLVETLNEDVAKAITHLSNQLSPAVDAKVEDVRAAAEAAIKRVEADVIGRIAKEKAEVLERLALVADGARERDGTQAKAQAKAQNHLVESLWRIEEREKAVEASLVSIRERLAAEEKRGYDEDGNPVCAVADGMRSAIDQKISSLWSELGRLEHRTDTLALRSEVGAGAKPDDQTLSELAAVKGLLAAAERRLTASNGAHAKVAAENKAAIEKLTKAFESFRVRVSNRIALEARRSPDGWKTSKLRDWLKAFDSPVNQTTFETVTEKGWIRHFVNGVAVGGHPPVHLQTGILSRCEWCEMAETVKRHEANCRA